MGDLPKRVLSAIVLILLAFLALSAPVPVRNLFVIVVFMIASWEFASTVEKKLGKAWMSFILPGFLLLYHFPIFTHFSAPKINIFQSILFLALPFVVCLLGFRKIELNNLTPWLSLQITGALLLVIWGTRGTLNLLGEPGIKGATLLLLAVVCMVFSDSGGYFAGRAFGKTKLSKNISPKKTWEGAAGGLILTIIVSGALFIFVLKSTFLLGALFGVFMWFAALVGDLVMSALKRYAGVKDFSRLIPGHGGILDRFDSLLFAAPVASQFFRLL